MPPVIKAVLWMLLGAVSFVCMAVAGREASKEVSTLEIMLVRSVLLMIFVTGVALVSKRGIGQLDTRRIGLHFVRSLAHFAGQFLWFFSLALIPLAQVFALEFTMPIWIAILAPIFLGERMTLGRFVAALLGFIGVLIVSRPDMNAISIGTAAMLVSAVGFALSHITMKRMITTETPLALVFYLGVFLAPLSLGAYLVLGGFQVPSPMTFGLLVAITLAGFSAHYCLAKAYALADTMVAAPLDFVRLPLMAVVAAALYGEPVEIWVLIGGVLILTGNLTNVFWEHRRAMAAGEQLERGH